jgi:hypothetical protein
MVVTVRAGYRIVAELDLALALGHKAMPWSRETRSASSPGVSLGRWQRALPARTARTPWSTKSMRTANACRGSGRSSLAAPLCRAARVRPPSWCSCGSAMRLDESGGVASSGTRCGTICNRLALRRAPAERNQRTGQALRQSCRGSAGYLLMRFRSVRSFREASARPSTLCVCFFPVFR